MSSSSSESDTSGNSDVPPRDAHGGTSSAGAGPSSKQPAGASDPPSKGSATKENPSAPAVGDDFNAKIYGSSGPAVEIKAKAPVRLQDVQDLVLWVLSDAVVCPRWVFVKNKPLIKQVVLMFASGITASLYNTYKAQLSHLPQLGEPAVVLAQNSHITPGKTAANLLTVPQPKKGKRKQQQQQQQQQADHQRQGSEPPLPPHHYVMDLKEMEAHGYVVPVLGDDGQLHCPDGFVATRPRSRQGPGLSTAAGGAAASAAGVATAPAVDAAAAAAASAAADGHAGANSPQEHAQKKRRLEGGSTQPGSSSSPGQLNSPGHRSNSQQQEQGQGQGQSSSQQGHPQDPNSTGQAGVQQQEPADSETEEGEVPPPPPAPPGAAHGRHHQAAPSHGHHNHHHHQQQQQQPPQPAPPWASNMVAMDCEMCETAEGLAVTRVSVVDAGGRVLLDELVMPQLAITNYLTPYSGITPAMMQGVTTTLEDIQRRLLQIIHADTLLVGHDLRNDLTPLGLVHCRVLDTCHMYPRGLPHRPKLRMLAWTHLRRAIQGAQHDSVEDARAAMDLALLKIQRGPSYGVPQEPNREKLVDVLAGSGRRVRTCLVDRTDVLHRQATGSASAIPVTTDAAAAAEAAKQARQARLGLLWVQLRDLQNFYNERSNHTAKLEAAQLELAELQQLSREEKPTKASAAAGSGDDPELQLLAASIQTKEQQLQQQYAGAQLLQRLQQLDKHVGQIHAALPANSLLVVASGQGDMRGLQRQLELKTKRQQGVEGYPPWTTADDKALSQLTEETLRALCFCAIKA